MRRVPGGLLLTFLSARSGERGDQLVVAQAAWDRHGTESYSKKLSLAQLRQQERCKSNYQTTLLRSYGHVTQSNRTTSAFRASFSADYLPSAGPAKENAGGLGSHLAA